MAVRRVVAPVLAACVLLAGCSGPGSPAPGSAASPSNGSAGGAVNPAPATAARPEPTSCRGVVTSDALPVWARGGFTGDASGYPHVLSTQGHLVAVLFAYPPKASRKRTVQNKILWVGGAGDPATRPQENPPTLRIRGRLADGTTMTREVDGGPGPSYVSFPRKGCWHLELSWWGRQDSMLIPVT